MKNFQFSQLEVFSFPCREIGLLFFCHFLKMDVCLYIWCCKLTAEDQCKNNICLVPH